MTDRPIALFRDGKLLLDSGFADYGSVSRFSVWMRGACLAESLNISEENGRDNPWVRQKLSECLAALQAYDEFTGENDD